MIFDTLRFATKGVRFEYTAEKDADSLRSELKKLSFLRATFGKTRGIVRKNTATLYRMRFPILHMGKPVLYVTIGDEDDRTLVEGAFTFAVWARVLFWLLLIFSFGFLATSSFRLYMGMTDEISVTLLIALILRMLIGQLVGYITFSWFHWTWKQCKNDMSDIAEGLEAASK